MITIKIKIGKTMLEGQFNDVKSAHKFSAIYGALPNVCDACGKDNIYLSHKNIKDNEYFTIVCKDCGAELSLHQKKVGGGFYVKFGDKMKVFQVNQEQQTNDPYQAPTQEEDIPF